MNKGYVIDRVWQYSRYHGNLLGYCEVINDEYNSFASLILLFNALESVLKNRLNNFDDNFVSLINSAYDKQMIDKIECDFLNDSKGGIRKIRNLLAHANISKYNFRFLYDKDKILYPFSENENCKMFYDLVSPIIFIIILKLVKTSFITEDIIETNNAINQLRYEIVELTPSEILKFKGFRDEDIAKLPKMDESTQYRLAENAGEVGLMANIFEKLFCDDN